MSASDLPLAAGNVTVRLGGTPIISEANLNLKAGDLALLTGPNGAGKSTFLRALVNLLPSDGDIYLSGFRPGNPAARSRFTYVPDEAALYEDLTLAEHTHFTALIYGQAGAEERMRSWLELFGLEGRLGEYPTTHSRGMRQKLALALALGLDTPLLVLDEPFNGLDAEAQQQLAAALRERCVAGGAVLLTGHQNELQDSLGARVLRLDGGQLSA